MRLISIAVVAGLVAALAAAPAQAFPERGPIVTSEVTGTDRTDAAQSGLGATRESAADDPLPGPPTWPTSPEPIVVADATERVAADDGTPWDTIAVGLAGAAIALTLAAAVIGLRRRSHRPRVAA